MSSEVADGRGTDIGHEARPLQSQGSAARLVRSSSTTNLALQNGTTPGQQPDVVRRAATTIINRRLPWLEARNQEQSAERSLRTLPASPEQQTLSASEAKSTGRPSLVSLTDDLTLRPIASEPTPDTVKVVPLHPKSYSTSPPRSSGLRSPPIIRRKHNTPDPDPSLFSYASSEYSTSTPSDGEPMPASLPKKDPASYEKLVMAPNTQTSRRSPLQVMNEWLESELDLPFSEPSPANNSNNRVTKGTTTLKPNPNPYRYQAGPSNVNERSEPCKSCDTAHGSRSKSGIKDMVVTTTATGTQCSPLMPSPTKKPTLHVLPSHLMAASSTSSQSDPGESKRMPSPQVRNALATAPSSSLNRAVTGLENLMEEALNVARDAAKTGRPEEVASVLNNATLALRKANTVSNGMVQPLVLASSDSELSPAAASRPIRGPTTTARAVQVTGLELPQSHPNLLGSSADDSISHTPPELYHPPSAESIVRDFAYATQKKPRRISHHSLERAQYGAAATFYGDHGESITEQPGVRQSFAVPRPDVLEEPAPARRHPRSKSAKHDRVHRAHERHRAVEESWKGPEYVNAQGQFARPLRRAKAAPENSLRALDPMPTAVLPPQTAKEDPEENQPRLGFLSGLIRSPNTEKPDRKASIARSDASAGRFSLRHPRRTHISVRESEGYNVGKFHKHQPIAREWKLGRKRMTSAVACLNTIFVGLIAGIYAGEVPRIQYQLADESHWVIFGNMLLFTTLGLTTLIFWPLPLLHGRRPYILVAFGLMLPLQLPQAMTVTSYHGAGVLYRIGLLLPRALTGLALGFANVNFLPTLWDL